MSSENERLKQDEKRQQSPVFTQIEAVVEKQSFSLTDRLAAAAAMFVVSGTVWFLLWIFIVIRANSGPAWAWPLVLTLLCSLFSFISPASAEYYVGKLWNDGK